MKFGKKYKDISNAKTIEPRVITGINRLVCTSKSHNVELKGKFKFSFDNIHSFIRSFRFSQCRWTRMEQCEILSNLITMAHAHQTFSLGNIQ